MKQRTGQQQTNKKRTKTTATDEISESAGARQNRQLYTGIQCNQSIRVTQIRYVDVGAVFFGNAPKAPCGVFFLRS